MQEAAPRPPTQPSPAVPPSPPQNTNPYRTIVLGIALLLLVGAGVYAGYRWGTSKQPDETPPAEVLPSRSPSPSPILSPAPMITTPDWKTYTDQKNGFSLQYPGNWKAATVPGTNGNVVFTSPTYVPITSGNVVFDGEAYLLILPNPNNLPIKDLYALFSDTSALWFSRYANETIVTPLPGVKFPLIQEGNEGYKRTEYMLSADRKVISLSYLYTAPQVMNEFTRLVNSVTLQAPDALVFTNNEFGFSFSLPETWRGYAVSSDTGPNMRMVTLTVKSPSPQALPVGTLTIYVFEKSVWNSQGKKPKYIIENATYVFATDPEIPPPDDCVQLDEFQCARRKEIPSILNTFRLK